MKKKDLLKLLELIDDDTDIVIYDSAYHESKDIAKIIHAIADESGNIFDPAQVSPHAGVDLVMMIIGYGDFVETGKDFKWYDLIGSE